MKPDDLLDNITNQLANAPDGDALAHSLTELKKRYEKQNRQLNSLTKLSDSTQAKLTDSNTKLEKLLRNLRRYVPAAVVDILLQSGTEQLPTNRRHNITVFFSDIVGFTGITERLEPERLASLMTEYFTEMTDICTRWGGTLDQFVGDAIVIFFGAPTTLGAEEDARRALGMALDMQDRLVALRQKWAQEGLTTPLEVRIGLSTGICNVGNFGSAERLHYTAIGTAVNSAARIQSLAEANHILLSENTYLLVRDHYQCEMETTAILSGQKHQTTLYRPQQNQDSWQATTITADEDGYRLYVDPAAITDKDKVRALLTDALKALDTPRNT